MFCMTIAILLIEYSCYICQMIDYLIDLDTQLFLFFHNIRAPFLDSFMWMFSKRLIWAPMYATILIFLFRRYNWRQALIFTLAVILTITLADQLCASHLRPFFARLRPSNPENPLSAMVTIVNNYRSGSFGFPSCHAANTFALATIVSLIARQRGLTIFMFLWALITCYSRVYLGVHYPGDLIFGGIIGWLCALLVYYVATGISSRLLMPAHTRPARRRFMRFKPAALIILAGITTIIVITAVSLWKA